MERDSATARIAFALVAPSPGDQLSLFEPDHELLLRTVENSEATAIERYNRVWRMGRLQIDTQSQRIRGKIGYESKRGGAELWNDDLEDFEEVAILQGHTSPFILDLSTARLVFQLRAPDIRPRTFTGAFQALINANTVHKWRVFEEVEEISWDDWRRSVDRVTKLRVSLERPNPRYGDRKQLEGIIEGSRSAMMKAILEASDEEVDGLNVDDSFVAESIRHVEAGYGSFAADGDRQEQGERHTTSWSSTHAGSPIRRSVEIAHDQVEVPFDILDAALSARGISPDIKERMPPLSSRAIMDIQDERLMQVSEPQEVDDLLEPESDQAEGA